MIVLVPPFLRSLDSVVEFPADGWAAECPICRGALIISRGIDRWNLDCDNCDGDEIADWLQADTRINSSADSASRRLWRAIVLSPKLETLIAMLDGQDVPVSALDPLWQRRFGMKR